MAWSNKTRRRPHGFEYYMFLSHVFVDFNMCHILCLDTPQSLVVPRTPPTLFHQLLQQPHLQSPCRIRNFIPPTILTPWKRCHHQQCFRRPTLLSVAQTASGVSLAIFKSSLPMSNSTLHLSTNLSSLSKTCTLILSGKPPCKPK